MRNGPEVASFRPVVFSAGVLRLVDVRQITWQDRAHFMAMCAPLMRRVLGDFSRSKKFQKRGKGEPAVSIDEVDLPMSQNPDLVELDDALSRLTSVDERKGKAVELRFFGGLTVDETAEVLKVSPDTACLVVLVMK